jgi:hypothetical protein
MTTTRREFLAASAAVTATAQTPPEQYYQAQPTDRPTRRWTVFLVQHSHIDVGYTERQEVIADFHAQFVRQAVNFAHTSEQRGRPADRRFRFTAEGFWQLEQYLARASADDRRRLVAAMHAGDIELTACYFHLTELLDEQLLRSSLRPAAEFSRRENVPLVAAMGCDINGMSWAMADALAEAGVRYLSMNINPHHGGYPFGRPLVPFYWESPKGKRVLVWNGTSYHKANLLGLMGGAAPDGDPGIPGLNLPFGSGWFEAKDTSIAERKLLPVLAWLEKTGYPFDFLLLTGSGVYTDNSPVTDRHCALVEQWNSKHGSQVYLRTAILADFFARLEKAPGIPVHRGEWTDWWSEGVGSAPLDTLIFRNAQRQRHMIDMLDSDHRIVPAGRLEEIDRKLFLYAEHTFGYSHTSSSTVLTHQVFLGKTKHAVDADQLAGKAVFEILRSNGEGGFVADRPAGYTVWNPLPEPVRGAAYLPLDFWEAPFESAGFEVMDESGKPVPHQIVSSPRGWNVAVTAELGAGGRRKFRLEPAPRKESKPGPAGESFENRFYRAAWREDSGIVSFVDRATGLETLDPARGALASPVYQIFPGAERYPAGRVSGKRVRPREEVSRGELKSIRRTDSGPVFERWEFDYQVAGASRYVLAAVFFHELPHVELTVSIVKTDVRDPEGMYVLFPLVAGADALWHLDKPGAMIRPGRDQLPRACCDYYCIQQGAALAGARAGVVLATPDAPLVQIGALRLWTFTTSIEPTGPLYSWLTNNKWETNFKISCGGAYDFRYLLEAGAAYASVPRAAARLRQLSYPPVAMRS